MSTSTPSRASAIPAVHETAAASATFVPTEANLDRLIDAFADRWVGAGDIHETLKLSFGKEPIGAEDTRGEFLYGRCHDFARGLAQFLESKGIQSEGRVLFWGPPDDGKGRKDLQYVHSALKVGDLIVDVNGAAPEAVWHERAEREYASNCSKLNTVGCASSEIALAIRTVEKRGGVPRYERASINKAVSDRVEKTLHQAHLELVVAKAKSKGREGR